MQVEAFDEVERAFVHVDYINRPEPEHKVDYNLRHNRSDLFDAQEVMRSAASQSGHLSGQLSGSPPVLENGALSSRGASPSAHSQQNNEGSQHRGDHLV